MRPRLGVAVLVAVLASASRAQAQTAQPPDVQPSDYDAVIAVIFEAQRPAAWETRIALQYLYDRAGESQIVISRRDDGRFQIDRWFLPAGTAPVFEQLQRMAAARPRPANEVMASRIRIRRESRLVDVMAPLGQLANEAYTRLRIPFVRAAPMFMDSAFLRAEVWSVGTQLTVELSEPDKSRFDRPDNVLAAWLRRIREETERVWGTLPEKSA